MQLSKMVPEVDTHTHTVVSGHAWSTLTENCLAARARGLKGLCLTEHGPAIEGGAPSYIPHSQRMLPETVEGVRVYKGVELNILDHAGRLDIPPEYLRFCEFAIASIHTHMFPERAKREENTAVYVQMLKNPCIDILGLLELNNNSTTAHRPGSLDSLKQYILCCKAHGQRVCVASDAHFHTMVGRVEPLMALLEELDFPPELIVNLTKERFDNYLKERNRRIQAISN